MEHKNTWRTYSKKQLKECEEFSKGYRHFLDHGKTERECVDTIVNEIEACGYRELEKVRAKGEQLKAGDKVYSVWMNKAIVMYQVGTKPITEGMNILGAHIDSPRLDVKQNPLYEEGGFAYLDTHYYGGIKKYQWVALPLAMHGVVVKKDGTTVIVNIGDKKDDPVFFISDLLIHLSAEQLEKKAAKVIEGEALDIVIGNKPYLDAEKNSAKDSAKDGAKDNAKDGVKDSVLALLKEYYDMEEEDFISAELEIVPAGHAKEAGLDRSMIMAYGQDDRVCAYASYKAMLEVEAPERTTCCILVDKEEIGSVGATGMQSKFFENSVAELMDLTGQYSELALRRCLAASDMLSSDVSSAFDPSFAGSFDKKNVAYLGNGMVFNKFTGSRGKSGSNDANAEYLAHIRAIFEKEKVNLQTAELGHYTEDDRILEDGTRIPVYNDNDKVYQGTTAPPVYWNLRNDFTLWKDLTLSVSLYSYMGHKSRAGYWLNQENGGSQVTNGFNVAARKYWTPDNPTNDYCRLNAAGPNTGLANGVDKVYNRSFVRLDDITLGYTLPQKWTRKFMIDRIRLTASCKNVCTFDNWEYGDPETGGLATRTFNFGINVTL